MILDEIEWPGEDFDLIDATLRRLHRDGLECRSMLLHADGILDMLHIAEASNSVTRVPAGPKPEHAVCLGLAVTGYRDPVTGTIVDLAGNRWIARGRVRFSDILVPKDGPLGVHPDASPP